MDIADVDLNLLVVFDALLHTGSVTGAARRLGMSQPATSFALNRLRKMFGDPLFVRTSRGIHPTPFAERLAAPLAGILDRIRTDLLQEPTFDAAAAERLVTFNMQDIGELVFLPRILERLNALAPGLQIRTLSLPLPQIDPALRSGEIDLALGHFPGLGGATLYQQRLFTHSYVCVVRADHPSIGSEISRKQFLEGRHAIIHPTGQMNDALETELQAQGLTRRVSISIEHFLAVPTILGESDLIFTVPFAIGQSLAKLVDVKLLRPPFRAKPRVVRQHWHSRFHHDPANRWLRGVVSDLFLTKQKRGRSEPSKA